MLAGVTQLIGNALLLDNTEGRGQVISIGIAPWGIVEKKYQLCGNDSDVTYHPIPTIRY
jgi:hypothetical protein